MRNCNGTSFKFLNVHQSFQFRREFETLWPYWFTCLLSKHWLTLQVIISANLRLDNTCFNWAVLNTLSTPQSVCVYIYNYNCEKQTTSMHFDLMHCFRGWLLWTKWKLSLYLWAITWDSALISSYDPWHKFRGVWGPWIHLTCICIPLGTHGQNWYLGV